MFACIVYKYSAEAIHARVRLVREIAPVTDPSQHWHLEMPLGIVGSEPAGSVVEPVAPR